MWTVCDKSLTRRLSHPVQNELKFSTLLGHQYNWRTLIHMNVIVYCFKVANFAEQNDDLNYTHAGVIIILLYSL